MVQAGLALTWSMLICGDVGVLVKSANGLLEVVADIGMKESI